MVGSSFELKHDSYDEYAEPQDFAANLLFEFFDFATGSLLEIGSGSGILTDKILQSKVIADYTAVDLSRGSLNKLQNRHPSVRCVLGDIMRFNERKFDFIVSSSSLHWIIPFSLVPEKLESLIDIGGECLFSVMLDGTLIELHKAKRALFGQSELGISLPSAEQVSDCFSKRAWKVELLIQKSKTFTHQSSSDLLRSLNKTGVNPRLVAGRPLSRGELKELETILPNRATYVVGVFRAFFK